MILDSGAVLAVARGDDRVAAAIRVAQTQGADIIVPPIVVAQTIRAGPRDAPIHRLLRVVQIPFVGVRLARVAGELLGKSGLRDAADALVMAEALRNTPAILLTSDPDDMSQLAMGRADIRIVPV